MSDNQRTGEASPALTADPDAPFSTLTENGLAELANEVNGDAWSNRKLAVLTLITEVRYLRKHCRESASVPQSEMPSAEAYQQAFARARADRDKTSGSGVGELGSSSAPERAEHDARHAPVRGPEEAGTTSAPNASQAGCGCVCRLCLDYGARTHAVCVHRCGLERRAAMPPADSSGAEPNEYAGDPGTACPEAGQLVCECCLRWRQHQRRARVR